MPPNYHQIVAARVRRDIEWLAGRCQQFEDYVEREYASRSTSVPWPPGDIPTAADGGPAPATE